MLLTPLGGVKGLLLGGWHRKHSSCTLLSPLSLSHLLSLHRAREAASGPHPLWGPEAEAQAHVSPFPHLSSTSCHPWGLFSVSLSLPPRRDSSPWEASLSSYILALLPGLFLEKKSGPQQLPPEATCCWELRCFQEAWLPCGKREDQDLDSSRSFRRERMAQAAVHTGKLFFL